MKAIKIALSIFAATGLLGCGGGGDSAPSTAVIGAAGSVTTVPSSDEVVIQAGTSTVVDGTVETSRYLLKSMGWQVSPLSPTNAELTLKNQTCDAVTKNDFVDPIMPGGIVGQSTWTCTLGVASTTNVTEDAVYKLLLVGTDGSGQSTTVTKYLRVKPDANFTAPAIALAPASLTIGNCTTRVPFIFSGGNAPYTTYTSDNFQVPVSSPIPLGDGRWYFFADFRYTSAPIAPATLTVLDYQSRTATATIITPYVSPPCPTNPLFVVSPEAANFRSSEVLAFQLSGGASAPTASDLPRVTFADPGVAQVVSLSSTTVKVQATSNVPATTLMTVASADGLQRASVVITVLPQP